MKKTIIYTRFSPRRNADESESNETQMAYCEKYAAEHDLEIIGRYEDRELSGADEERPGMWAAIEALPRGGVLLVWKLDRLARNVYLAELVKRAVEVKKGTIAAVSGDVEGNGPEQVMIRQVLNAISEYERKIIALRTKYAMLHKQTLGQRMGRFAPYGWTLNPLTPGRLSPVEKEQEAIARIKALAAEGYNANWIAGEMNRELPEYARAGKWSRKTVAKIIGR